jgi:chromate transporter
MALLTAALGWQHTYTQMAWFFTKAALLTFGGAYAVLPYVFQGAVAHYGWLSATQMMDGLALGETTPGPLIMVVAFVGFVGAYGQALLGPEQWFIAGALGACIVTWFTFLPSFMFILAGGPLVESTHGSLPFTAPLTAITAAVVGVIAQLAVTFGQHAFFTQTGSLNPWAVVIAAGAALALFRFKWGVIRVILAAGAAGLALQMLR